MDSNNLNKYLTAYWTPAKCGKHTEIIKQHAMVLMLNLKVEPEDLFEQINENKFTFQNFKLIPWSDFLKSANLAEYLKPEYVKDALEVTTSRPAIGKGEFLFVSCFGNLGFASGKGDIVDLRTKKICEFKGVRSTLSGDNKIFKQMNKSLIYSIFSLFDAGAQHTHFNRECAVDIDNLLKDKPNLLPKVLERLQNVSEPNMKVSRAFAELYNIKSDLFNIVGAMQLYIYMNVQNASYILFTNNDGFCCYEKPQTPQDAYRIVTELKLSSWMEGDYGMTIGI